MLSLALLSVLTCYVMPGFGVAMYPGGLGGAVGGHRSGMGFNAPPFGPLAFRGGMGPAAMPHRGLISPVSRGMSMQSPLRASPYTSPSFPGMGGSQPLDRCNGGNCGYWGGCQGGHCGEFYDFRPCHTPECFDGPIHGFDCADGSCKRVCNGPNCRDFVIHACSGKGSPAPDHSDVSEPSGNGKN
ncbi:hypothetical protein EGR_09916 [Echinococcus granulosus]|uniref:Uncharacterized protein n=1 Tax=Echinococcus granulosus TaxID=6210 RepID=W6U2D3_ECHGR|nr:hypothetical protein EGR_09916 [Echinococcus granulosus]EUB55223.1 hypothetical protein EGR_09916 [Echinococcus granulosus]